MERISNYTRSCPVFCALHLLALTLLMSCSSPSTETLPPRTSVDPKATQEQTADTILRVIKKLSRGNVSADHPSLLELGLTTDPPADLDGDMTLEIRGVILNPRQNSFYGRSRNSGAVNGVIASALLRLHLEYSLRRTCITPGRAELILGKPDFSELPSPQAHHYFGPEERVGSVGTLVYTQRWFDLELEASATSTTKIFFDRLACAHAVEIRKSSSR